jgi:hypothetical protein
VFLPRDVFYGIEGSPEKLEFGVVFLDDYSVDEEEIGKKF